MAHQRSVRRVVGTLISVTTLVSGTGACATGASSSGPVASQVDAVVITQRLVGTWDFIQQCGGIAGRCVGIEQTTEPHRYVFRADGVVEAYRSGRLTFTARYEVRMEKQASSKEERGVLYIGFGPTSDPRPLSIQFGSRETLLLDEGCCDRYAFEYRRAG